MTYEIGDFLTNAQEVTYNAVIVEIVHMWEDPDDGEVNYIIKCRGYKDVMTDAQGRWAGMSTPWLCEDELKLVNDYMLDKYYH